MCVYFPALNIDPIWLEPAKVFPEWSQSLLCLKDIVFLESSSTCDSHNLSNPSSSQFPEP